MYVSWLLCQVNVKAKSGPLYNIQKDRIESHSLKLVGIFGLSL